jgi:A/G-specific adenine glycosylase
MLQQTQVKTVVPYWERWMRELPTIPALAAAPTERVLKLWEGLGYYSRARNLHRAASSLTEFNTGRFPEAFDDVLALPGIGRYTAGAICSIAFNQPRPILDGNVVRVLTRLLALRGDPRARQLNDRLWQVSSSLVGEAAAPRYGGEACSHANQALMELGATVCTPTNPDCDRCPLRRLCLGHAAGKATDYPQVNRRLRTMPRRFATVLLRNRRRWLIRQRPNDGINGGFWEFPSIELEPAADSLVALAGWLNLPADSFVRAGRMRHAITRYRITQELFRGTTRRTRFRMLPKGRWVTRTELDRLHLTGAHRKIAADL